MKKSKLIITLGETMPTLIKISDKYDPVAFVVERAMAVIHLNGADDINSNIYRYFMLKRPELSGDLFPMSFKIEAKNEIRKWELLSKEGTIRKECIAKLNLYIKTDFLSLELGYMPQCNGKIARVDYGFVTDDSSIQVLMQQRAESLISDFIK